MVTFIAIFKLNTFAFAYFTFFVRLNHARTITSPIVDELTNKNTKEATNDSTCSVHNEIPVTLQQLGLSLNFSQLSSLPPDAKRVQKEKLPAKYLK